jgi:hypothetical protein
VSNPNPNFNYNINTNPTGSPTLGSYSHTHRKKNFKAAIKEARLILIIIGTLMILGNSVMTYLQWSDVDKLFDKMVRQEEAQLGPGMILDPVKVEEARQEFYYGVYIVLAMMVAVGLVLIVLGMTVHLAPVPIAISSLAIYLGYHAILAVMDESTIIQGWIWKIIVIACLVKVIQAAQSYQSDLRRAERELAAQGRPLPLQ